jgi:endonuclease/exonuclease/phosphatase family metal-dependent hydrolase
MVAMAEPAILGSVRGRHLVFAALGVWLLSRITCGSTPSNAPPDDGPLFATFNIEHFPKDDRQVEGAFATIRDTRAGIIAVQEIVDTYRFQKAAHQYLGTSWHFVWADTRPIDDDGRHPPHNIGVVYDTARYRMLSAQMHHETRINGRQKPTFELRLQPAEGGPPLRLLVVHLKSGSDGRPMRARQFAALGEILRKIRGSGDHVALMGDFNATEEADRDDLAALARGAHMVWATERLACSAFWNREDDCPTSRLDHVITWTAPARVDALGGCTDGCATRDSCPLYSEQVSDHCPVALTFAP